MTQLEANRSTELNRTLKPQWVFAMALGSAVGWGAFILPFDWLNSGGLLGVLIGFFIGGGMITIIALSYGAVIRALPVSGGGLAFALASLGRTHGFIAGWALTLGYAGIVALNASAVTLVFRVTLPNLVMQGRLYTVAGWGVYLPEVIIATLFLVIFALINAGGAEMSGRFQFIAVILMLIAIVFIFISCVIYYFTVRPPMAPIIPSEVNPLTAVAVIVAFAPWAYVGFDTVPQLAGEFKFTPRKALGLLLWGVIAATLIYMAMTTSTAIAMGDQISEYEGNAWPTASAISEVIGPIGMLLMVLAVSMGVLTGLNGFYASTSRVLLTMGRANMISPRFADVHPKFGTPVNAIVFTTALCLITPWFGRAALSWVVDMTSVGITVAYFYTCYCSYRIGKKGYVFGMKDRLPVNRIQQIVGLFGCLLAIGFLLLLLIPTSPGALSIESQICLAIWVLSGVTFFFLRRRVYFSTSSDILKKEVFQQP